MPVQSFTYKIVADKGADGIVVCYTFDFGHTRVERIVNTANNQDFAQIGADMVEVVNLDVVEAEIRQNMGEILANGSAASLTFNESTLTQLRNRMRERFRTLRGTELVMLGDFLYSLNNAQLAIIFNITQQQAQTLVDTKLAPMKTAADIIRNIQGE